MHLVLNKNEILLLENFSAYNRFATFNLNIDLLYVNEQFLIIIDHLNNPTKTVERANTASS